MSRHVALNLAVDQTSDEFVAVVEAGDELEPFALATTIEHLVDHPGTEAVYTDEDRIAASGERSVPFFKPDWSPDLLRSQPYVTRLLVVRRDALRAIGAFRPGFDGSELFDLGLRLGRWAPLGHVARVGYHRRTDDPSPLHPALSASDLAALRADAALDPWPAVVEHGLVEGTARVRRNLTAAPKVTILVPFRDGADLLRKCVDSIEATAGYDRWELVLLDNRSWEPETDALLARLADQPRCRILDHPHPFNWSEINNRGARETDGDVLLFLNSDIEGRRHGWMLEMLEQVQRPEVGVVGARLLYPDHRVQHAGAVLGLGAWVAWHAFVFAPEDHPGYFGHAKAVRNYSAVTGAAMMVRRDTFDTLAGFDETLSVAFNDMDFCLRAIRAGYTVVYTPYAELYHHEGASRGRSAVETDATREMTRRWASTIRRDPFFNRNLDPARSEFALSVGDTEVDPWERLFSTVES